MRRMSIKHKIFISYSVLIVSVLLCTVMISQKSTSRAFEQNITQEHRRELLLITNGIKSNLEHLKDYSMSIALDPEVISILEANPKKPENIGSQFELKNKLGKRVTSIVGVNQSIFQWDIIALDKSFFYVNGAEILNSMSETLSSDFYAKISSGRASQLSGPYIVDLSSDGQEQLPVFVMSKQILNIDTLKPLGYIVFFITEPSLAETFQKDMPPELQQNFYLLSDKNEILSSTKKEFICKDFGETIDLSQQNQKELFDNGKYLFDNGRNSYLYTATPMEINGWKVVYETPLAELMNSQYQVRWFTLVIGFTACIFALILAGVIAHKITNPIIVLSKKMSLYYMKKPKPKVSYASNNEIDNLYTGFDTMVENSERMMRQIYNDQEEKSKYKFQLIQSQIKPHFLYNTLEMIKSLIDIGMNNEAAQAVMAVSKFYRMSLNDGNDITSVKNEIELARQYMYIQKLRYMEYLNYKIDHYTGLNEYVIPKLTLQPLLENAIYHGIKNKQETGEIHLIIRELEETIEFVVEDNGMGMEKDTLAQVKDSLHYDENKNVMSFGLYSINRRLQLFFGEEYGLTIDSVKGQYTRVALTLPKKNDIQAKEVRI